jgi:YgiT-type zinc finger domain-containing protein
MAQEHTRKLKLEEMFESCPVCGGELVKRQVEEILRGGNDTATLSVEAMVCRRCGERLYSEYTVRRFERIRANLSRGTIEGLEPVGRAYRVS